MNNTSCLTTTLLIIRVVVGGLKKSLVLSILIREPHQCEDMIYEFMCLIVYVCVYIN